MQEAYDKFLAGVETQARTPDTLIQAVAEKDGVPVELFEILLMCEHLFSALCKTVWSKGESWDAYVERVRVYDPTGLSFKRIHFALLFGHGLPTTTGADGVGDDARQKSRPAPSQQNLIHGQGVPLRKLLFAGLRMINVNEAHLEHRHMIRKAFINLCCLHQIAITSGRGKEKEQEADKMTRDRILRSKQLLVQQHLQELKMWFAGKTSFDKNPWSARYRKQVCIYVCENACVGAPMSIHINVNTQFADDFMDAVPDLVRAENSSDSDTEIEDEDPVEAVVNAAHGGTLSQAHLIAANVTIPAEADPLSDVLIDCMSELVVDRLPDPKNLEDLNELMETAVNQVQENTDHDVTNDVDETLLDDLDDDELEDGVQPLIDAPPKFICRCESVQSDSDKVCARRGKTQLHTHFLYGSGNMEIRSKEGNTTQADLIPMESIYALWMTGLHGACLNPIIPTLTLTLHPHDRQYSEPGAFLPHCGA